MQSSSRTRRSHCQTYYCDNFEKVVQSCPVPIIVAGGKKTPERDAMQLTYNAIKGGAVGVDMGRNIWQSEHPVAMIKAVKAIVHQNYNVDQAYKLYQKLISQEKKKPQGNKPQKKVTTKKKKQPKEKGNKPQKKGNKPNQKKGNPNQKKGNPNQKKGNKPNNQNKSNKPNGNQPKPNNPKK